MISHKYKCIHIHIPKCAGTSIDTALFGSVVSEFDRKHKLWKQHATAQQAKKYYTNEEQWNNYFKFAITRNPFDKMVSSYNWMCRHIKPCELRDKILFKDFIFRKRGFETLFNPNLTTKKENRYVQIKTATDFIMDENDNLMVDYVGRFENLKDDWNFICKQLGTKIKLGHRNKWSRDNKHYRDYYDDETREFITKACEKDLEIFGYEF
jgi:chondroitin 4-sulfotransferase 11